MRVSSHVQNEDAEYYKDGKIAMLEMKIEDLDTQIQQCKKLNSYLEKKYIAEVKKVIYLQAHSDVDMDQHPYSEVDWYNFDFQNNNLEDY